MMESGSGRNITNLWFADDIAEEEQELEALVESLDKNCTRYNMRSVPRRPTLCQTAPMASTER